MVERFHIFMFCLIIAARNILEVACGSPLPEYSDIFENIVLPLFITYASEVFVDWLKHSFITKFNGILPDVYKTFFDLLCRDFSKHYRPEAKNVKAKNLHTIPLKTASIARKIGFSPLPMTCLLLRITIHTLYATQLQVDTASLFYYGLWIYLS